MIFVAGLVVIGLFLVHRLVLGYPRPPARLEAVGPWDAAFLNAAADTFFPADGPLPVAGRDAELAARTDRYLAQLPRRQRLLIRALFMLIEQSTLIFPARGVGAFRRFSSMSPEQREAVIQGWADSGLYLRRTAFSALKAVLIMGYLGHPECRRALGFEPFELDTPVCEADLLYPPIGAPKTSIRFGREDLTAPSDGTPVLAQGRPGDAPPAVAGSRENA